jgi:cytochrome P450
MYAISLKLLDPLLNRGEMDIARDYSVPYVAQLMMEIIGAPNEDLSDISRWSETLLGASDSTSSDESNRSLTRIKDYMGNLVRGQSRNSGVLTHLRIARVCDKRLSSAELIGALEHLFLAGIESLTGLINNSVICLIENPDLWTIIRETPPLMQPTIEEVLRYRSPGQAAFRVVREPVEIHGHLIPAGQLVLATIGSANRDARHFLAPGRFDVTRRPNLHLAFGVGIHRCLAASFSRLAARVALSTLVDHVTQVEFATEKPWPPRRLFRMHGPARLPIRFQRLGGPRP